MNKKGGIWFGTATVIVVFIFIFSSIIYKVHFENKIKMRDVGLVSIDLLRQKENINLDSYFIKKEIEYKLNNKLFEFIKNGGTDYEEFFKSLNGEFSEYEFTLDGDVIEFNIKGVKGTGRITNVEECKKNVVELSEKQIGCKYVLGAKGPCENSFDCSGLVKWVYENANVGVNYFPDGSYIQADWGRRNNMVVSDEIGKGAELEVEKLEPGDIVFFRGSLPTDGYGVAEDLGIRHVGIYIGEGRIIEAAGKDSGVIESEIINKRDYRGAIRVCSENFKEGVSEGIFSKDIKYRYKIDLERKKFVTFEGLKSLT